MRLIYKVIILISIGLIGVNQAFGWGLLPEAGNGHTLLFRYLGKRVPVQPICVETQVDRQTRMPGLPLGESTQVDELVSLEENALNTWISQVRNLIQTSGRSDEFADLLAVWPERISVTKTTNCTQNNVLVLTYEPRRFRGAYSVVEQNGAKVLKHNTGSFSSDSLNLGAFTQADAQCESNRCEIRIFESLGMVKRSPMLMTHETGHLLGLADQYGNIQKDMHPYFSFLTVLDQKNLRTTGSVMNLAPYQTKIWPDDLDGIVNMVDLIQFYDKGVVSARMLKGWQSFSLGPNVYYAYAMPFRYNGPAEQRTVPDMLLERVKSYQKRINGIDVTQIQQLEAIDRETAAYLQKVETKIKELEKNIDIIPSGNLPLGSLSVPELKQLQTRAKVAYYQTRENAVNALRANYIDPLSYQTVKGNLSEQEYAQELQDNTAYATREINGKRYYGYDQKRMKKLLQEYEQLKHNYSDYPNVSVINQKELQNISTGYFTYKNGHGSRHCAGGGEEIDSGVPLVRYRYVNQKKQYVTRYFFLCEKHHRPDLGSENFKKYTFRTQEAAFAMDQEEAVTYGEIEAELQARMVQAHVRQQVVNSLQRQFTQTKRNVRLRS